MKGIAGVFIWKGQNLRGNRKKKKWWEGKYWEKKSYINGAKFVSET